MNRSSVERRKQRHIKVRRKVESKAFKPRLSVFRSNAHIYAQLIDDVFSTTLASASDQDKEIVKDKKKMTKTEVARAVGKVLAERAKAKKIDTVSFDRGGFLYKGRVKALAEGAREGGLKF